MTKKIKGKKKGEIPNGHGKQKYNWPALKAEYMRSDIDEVIAFLKHKFGVENKPFRPTGTMSKMTNGWSAEKKELQQKIYEEQLKIIEKDAVNFNMKLLTKVRHGLSKLVIQEAELRPVLNAENLAVVWRLVRTECGLPTSITKQENVDLTELEKAREDLEKTHTENDKKNNTVRKDNLVDIPRPDATAKS